jgi:hypothetical protein
MRERYRLPPVTIFQTRTNTHITIKVENRITMAGRTPSRS